jgi:hypothetical protein
MLRLLPVNTVETELGMVITTNERSHPTVIIVFSAFEIAIVRKAFTRDGRERAVHGTELVVSAYAFGIGPLCKFRAIVAVKLYCVKTGSRAGLKLHEPEWVPLISHAVSH